MTVFNKIQVDTGHHAGISTGADDQPYRSTALCRRGRSQWKRSTPIDWLHRTLSWTYQKSSGRKRPSTWRGIRLACSGQLARADGYYRGAGQLLRDPAYGKKEMIVFTRLRDNLEQLMQRERRGPVTPDSLTDVRAAIQAVKADLSELSVIQLQEGKRQLFAARKRSAPPIYSRNWKLVP